MKRFYSIVIFSFLSCVAFAQNQQANDSLLDITKNGSRKDKITAFNELSWNVAEIDPQKALTFAEEAIKLCKANEDSFLAVSINRKGGAYDFMGKYDSARVYYLQSAEIRKNRKDIIGYSNSLLNIGATYYYEGLYNKALNYYVQSAHEKEKVKDLNGLSKIYNNIGLLYRVQKKSDEALSYFRKSLNYKMQLNDTKGILNTYSNIGIIYLGENKCDSAIYYSEKAYRMSAEIESRFDIGSSLSNLGFAYLCAKEYKLADSYFNECLSFLEKLNDKHTLAFAYKGLGESQYYQKRYSEAIEALNKSYQIALGIKRKELLSEICKLQSQCYEKTANYKEEIIAYKKYIAYRDTVFSEDNNRQLNELAVSYETEKKEQNIKELSHQNELNKQQRNILIILSVAVLVILFLTYLNLRNKKHLNAVLDAQNKEVERSLREKEVLLREIHHRVKNNLQIINGLLELQESLHQNPDVKNVVSEAQGRIKTMAIIHEMLYQTESIANIRFTEYAQKLIDSIHRGFAHNNWKVEHNIVPSEIAFSIDTIIPLGLILNELVSNSYKYAFDESKQNKLTLRILKENEDTFQMIFSDNGIGINNENMWGGTSASFGLKLVKMLSRQLKGNVSYKYENGAVFYIVFKEVLK